MMKLVQFPDGTQVRATALSDRRERDDWRKFGLYLDPAWRPSWQAEVVEWKDFELPKSPAQAAKQIRAAFERAQGGEGVEVGCKGGLGRTGTVLACMAVLAGVPPEEAVRWVRKNYDPQAVETSDQERWVAWFSVATSRAWCVFRNLVHTVYREARHLGPSGDPEAKVTVADDHLLAAAAKRCQKNRQKLKPDNLHGATASATSPTEVLAPYQEMTGLSVDDVVTVFELPNWKPGYGGAKWARIAATLKELLSALGADDMERANRIGSEVSLLRHNSGPLIPSRSEWERNQYLREKWPELCE